MRSLILLLMSSLCLISCAINNQNYVEPHIDEATDILPINRTPEDQNILVFSPTAHLWAVYNTNGERVGLGKATGGRDYCQDIKETCRTVTGKFKVFRKEDEECTSHTFPIDEGGGAPMPFCIFFHKGYAIHGSNQVGNENISHGCIRVTKKAAKWINENYIHEGSYVLVLPYNSG